MRQRDTAATAVFRTALAAIDNAEAVPVAGRRAGAIELSPVGLGAAEVSRRVLDESTMCDIVRNEAVDLRTAAAALAGAAPDVEARMRRQADLLEAVLDAR